MNKTILTGTMILTLAGASLPSARAEEHEWATVGQVLTGVAVAGLVVAAADGHVHGSVSYSYNAPAYCPPPAPPCNYYPAPPPVVYYPPPVMVQPRPIVYYPPPVVMQPRPVVYYPSPVVYAASPGRLHHLENYYANHRY